MESKLLYSRKDAAEKLSISVRAVDYLLSTKKLPFLKIGKRVLFRSQDLERFASANHYDGVTI